MASRSVPSWVWLVLAAGLLVFAIVWLSLGGAGESEHAPSVLDNGRAPLPPGADISGVRRERSIERRERAQPSIVSPSAAVPHGAGGSAPARP